MSLQRIKKIILYYENKVIIFGHSLGETDGDILSKFILNKNVKTRIICYDEYDRAEKIRNLAVILVPDKLIELTGGSNPSITFEYEQFNYEEFEAEQFEYNRVEFNRFEPVCIDMVFLRRGVIGINRIGYDV